MTYSDRLQGIGLCRRWVVVIQLTGCILRGRVGEGVFQCVLILNGSEKGIQDGGPALDCLLASGN